MRKTGWKYVDREKVFEFARGYVRFLSDAKTPRRAVRGLLAMMGESAKELTGHVGHKPGTKVWLRAQGEQAIAFAMAGERPVEEGMRIVIAAVDAPRIDLKSQPLEDENGLTLLDTRLYGAPELKHWLSRPMALYVHAARPGAKDGPFELALGESPDDPVLSIPDLLPHLSGNIQSKKIVDSAERMDAVAARSRQALLAYLGARGFAERDFTTAEASIVPAGPAMFGGVDRAQVIGYGHAHRAFAYAAVRALADAQTTKYTSVVIVISKRHMRYEGPQGWAFVESALSRIASAFGSGGPDLDVLANKRIAARSAALVAHGTEGVQGKGISISPRNDDALPTTVRRVTDVFDAAGVHFQVVDRSAWGSPARKVGSLDVDALSVGIPTSGLRTPAQSISTLDLYQAHLACRGWFGR